MSHKACNQNGFIALITSIIISALLLVLIASSSLSSLYASENTLEKSQKQQSLDLANSCINMVLLRLSADQSFNGLRTWKIGTANCIISQISLIDSSFVFEIKVSVGNSFTNLKVVANKTSLNIISIAE